MRVACAVFISCLNLSGCMGSEGVPGPPGEGGTNGENGANGVNGADGSDGFHCWDLNQNRIGDADEDVNGDGAWNTLDCGSQGYLRAPLVLAGRTPDGCKATPGGTDVGWVEFPATFFDDPVFVSTIDESLDNQGPTWHRIRRLTRNRVGLRCNAPADAIHWLALEPGVHMIDGKKVQAGTLPLATSGTNIVFPEEFSAPPVIVLGIDESIDDNGTNYARVSGAPATDGFKIWLNGPADGLHWIAMEPGDYEYGRYQWRAGTITPPGDFTLVPELPSAPTVIMTIHDEDDNGPTWVRHLNITRSLLQYRMDGTSE